MPVYAYQCPEEHEFEKYVPLLSSENPECPTCGGVTEKIWRVSKRSGYQQYPYVTKNITGQPIEVTDASHEARLLKEHGLAKLDDAGWIETEYVGYNPYTGKQVYHEPSGVGLPGCWV